MAKKKKTHGGKRRGAGRKPLPLSQRSVPLAITLPRPLLNQLDELKAKMGWNRSEAIAEALREFVAKQ